MELRRTPLYPVHKKYQGKMIDFGGWELPVEYSGIVEEHQKVRTDAGLFDVSHMGEIGVRGDRALDYVQQIVTNSAAGLAAGQICYSPMCYDDGGVVDDLLVYKFDDRHFFIVVNAANTDKDYGWMREQAITGAALENLSSQFAELALQGPKAQSILQRICDADLGSVKYYWFLPGAKVAGVDCIVSRTGYTGEDGFEIFVAPDRACDVWEAIMSAGGAEIAPIGLGARDTLRFEAKMPLYGHELDREITPLEAGLDRYVNFDKPAFIGREALLKQKEVGLPRLLAEFVMMERGIPRAHYPVHKDGREIGWVTSGGYAPTLKKNLGLCLIGRQFAAPGTTADIIIRNKPVQAQIAKGIFYKRTKTK